MRWTIQTLVSGRRVSRESVMLHGAVDGPGIPIQVHFWVLRAGNQTIVVDTGLRPVPLPGNEHKFEQAPHEHTLGLLAAWGVQPAHITTVIVSHLHHDHFENATAFPRAEIVVSRRGWDYWQTERTAMRSPLYPLDVVAALEHGHRAVQLRLATDEDVILPGIRVAWSGGHTPCSQLVFVDTPTGRVVFTGDESFLYRNVEEDVPVGLHSNLDRARAALARAREDADLVIPSHDPLILQRHPGGFIG